MKQGDHLKARRRFYTHHAINIGDGFVVQYGRGLSNNRVSVVEVVRIAEFANGVDVQVEGYEASFSRPKIVRRALSRVGEARYHVLRNNCEHFAYWCRTGHSSSPQIVKHVERLKMGVANVAIGGVRAGVLGLLCRQMPKFVSGRIGRAVRTPWLFAADAAQVLVKNAAVAAGLDMEQSRRYGRTAGAFTSAGIGAATGGPIGACAAVGVWWSGDQLERLFVQAMPDGGLTTPLLQKGECDEIWLSLSRHESCFGRSKRRRTGRV